MAQNTEDMSIRCRLSVVGCLALWKERASGRQALPSSCCVGRPTTGNRQLTTTLAFVLALLTGCAYKHKDADLVIHNAHIVTLDSADHEFQAMAIKDGRVIELGPENQILNEYTAKETYDAAGHTVYPGFIDGHCHFFGYGLNKQKIDLQGVKNWDEALDRTVAFAKARPNSEWILGRGWDQNLWTDKSFPDNTKLNELFPDRPVLLQRVDGHAAMVNQVALDRVGLNAKSVIAGGILEVKNGKPTGLLVDNAVDVFQKIFDEADEPTKRQALLDAQTDCFEKGLTMVCDAGLDVGTIELIKKMQEEGALKIRVYAMVADKPENLEHFAKSGAINTDRLWVRSVKVYSDGALGSKGALLLKPYEQSIETDTLAAEAYARLAKRKGFNVSKQFIDSLLQERIAYFTKQIGSTEALEKFYGKSIAEIVAYFRPTVLRDQLAQRVWGSCSQRERDSISITLSKTPYGLLLKDRTHMMEIAKWCMDHDFQMATHCIGDSADRFMLDVYAEVLKGTNDKRWRIEHTQCMDPADFHLFADNSIIPSVQPTHLLSDAPWAIDRIGPERFKSAYAWNTLRKQIGIVALGTDFPVEAIDPLATYYAAVVRKYRDGSEIVGSPKEEALSPKDALLGMTLWNAMASFTENDLGTIETGKRADFTVVDRDLLKADEEGLRKAKVMATFVNGENVSE
jgi:predicted amidohydrolase YtcJ